MALSSLSSSSSKSSLNWSNQLNEPNESTTNTVNSGETSATSGKTSPSPKQQQQVTALTTTTTTTTTTTMTTSKVNLKKNEIVKKHEHRLKAEPLRRNSDTILVNSNQFLKLPLHDYHSKRHFLKKNNKKNSTCEYDRSVGTSESNMAAALSAELNSPTAESKREQSPNSIFSYDSLQPPSPSTPQSPMSPAQSHQSLLQQKLCSLIRNVNIAPNSNANEQSQPTGKSTTTSKSVVQYLNNKFLRKRHSVSILKFNNTNMPTNKISSDLLNKMSSNLTHMDEEDHLSSTNNTGHFFSKSPKSGRINSDTSYTKELTVKNSKLEKSISNQSFLSNKPEISINVPGPSEPIMSLKVPFKSKNNNASPTRNSFNVKKKTKRSKSAPINQRKILVNSTIYASLLSTNYNENVNNNTGCIYCDNKNQLASFSAFNTSLQEELLRRTNFSRRNYGSLELLFTLDREGIIQNIGKFRIENGDSRECLNTSNTIHLENPESQTRWYFKYFLGRIHQNYMIEDKNKNINFLSVVITDANDRHIPLYKVILWTKLGSQKLTLTYQHNKTITVKQILNHFQIETDKSPREILDPEIQKELLVLEEQEGSINFKFGVVYAKYGQLTDDEMLSNENGSPEFEKFIGLIGDRIRLKGWKRYRGGLDTSSDTTGEYSVYTIYEGHEIMFHVSTLLPYVRDSKQQLERKRHIGNDIVTIVFQDLDDNVEPDFNPSSARSQFQHIFALVTYNKKENSYRLKIYSEQSVPPFGPSLPAPPIFTNHKEFREFLLVKLINGEKSAFNNSVFGKRRKRTIEAIITNLYKNYEKESFKKVINSGSGFGEVISDALNSTNIVNKRKDEIRKNEFLRIGQNLKLQTIIKGDAPTSQLTTGVVKKELWEPKVFLHSFEHSIVSSDSWNNCVVVSTINGVFVIDEALPWDIKQIFDKTVQLRQLDVCELFGFMIFCDYKGHISVFKLNEFNQILSDSNWDNSQTKSKLHCKEHRLEFISGCHMYAISKQLINKNENFKLVAACGRKLYLIEYSNAQVCNSCAASINNNINYNSNNNSNVNTNSNNSNSNNLVNQLALNPMIGLSNLPITNTSLASSSSFQNFPVTELTNDITKMFQIKKEINCSDVPNLLNIVDSFSGENYILVAYKNKLEMFSEKSGESLKQFQFNPLSTIRSIVELYDNHKLEILVTYNYTSEFIKLDNILAPSQPQSFATSNQVSTNKSSYYSFQWNSEPNYVICAFPYIIGFANQCIEIRLLVNGNLVNSITMSNIKLIASKKDIFFSADHELFLSNEFSMAERHLSSLVINVTSTTTSSSTASVNTTANTNTSNANSAASGSDDNNSPPSSPNQDKDTSTNVYSHQTNINTNNNTSSSNSQYPPSSASNAVFLFSNMPNTKQQSKTPCSIYKICLDFLHQSNLKNNEKFNQLCENSKRTIQREISNFSSQFIFNDLDEMPKQYSIYQKIISSNKTDENESNEFQ